MAETKLLKTNCRLCARQTRHEVVRQLVRERNDNFFHETDTWQIIRCLGCESVSFRDRCDNFDAVTELDDGTTKHQVTVQTFPRVLANHRGLPGTYFLPPLIRKVYLQTLTALGEQANVLASIGLRACIEATCNEIGLSATSLEKRIDQLFKAGHVSNGDKRRLHAIRFLGNDAAHEIKEPSPKDIRIALEIVEHLLNTVFILEQRASSLDTVVETFEEFLTLLVSCIRKYESDDAVSLGGLLGSQRRLVGNMLDSFEGQLKTDIAEGSLAYLGIGATVNVAGKDVQLYEIKRDQMPEEDDVPF